MKIIEWDEINLEHIYILVGWSRRGLELTGAKNVHSKVTELKLEEKIVAIEIDWK